MSSCPKCGAEVTPSDRFCGDCGTPLAPGTGASIDAASSSDAAIAFSLGAASAPAFEPAAGADKERATADAPTDSASIGDEHTTNAPEGGGQAAEESPAPVSASPGDVSESPSAQSPGEATEREAGAD